jgi:hypothetical protein
MALPLRRWCNAVMAWVRNRHLAGGEEGQLKWQQVQEYVTTPPQRASATPASRSAAAARAAIMTPEQEAAAFAAFASETGA